MIFGQSNMSFTHAIFEQQYYIFKTKNSYRIKVFPLDMKHYGMKT